MAVDLTYTGMVIAGAGIASKMHGKRIGPVEERVGYRLHPGTLNVLLDDPFDWDAPHERLLIPDAVSWHDLEGRWEYGMASLYDVRVESFPAWVMRLDKSTAPPTLIEILSCAKLRGRLGEKVRVSHR